jgi:hypothetical protein
MIWWLTKISDSKEKDTTKINQNGAVGYILDPIYNSRDMAKHATILRVY